MFYTLYSKLVVGCGDGKLYMYHWKQFGYHSSDFPGHPGAINSLIGELNVSFVHKRALVKDQSQSKVFKVML